MRGDVDDAQGIGALGNVPILLVAYSGGSGLTPMSGLLAVFIVRRSLVIPSP